LARVAIAALFGSMLRRLPSLLPGVAAARMRSISMSGGWWKEEDGGGARQKHMHQATVSWQWRQQARELEKSSATAELAHAQA
jgi:hypothetical protein